MVRGWDTFYAKNTAAAQRNLKIGAPPGKYRGNPCIGWFILGFVTVFSDALISRRDQQKMRPAPRISSKRSAFVRSKLKNLQTGSTLEKTWKAGETFPDAQIDKKIMTYSYIDGDDTVFMDMESFEEERIATRREAAAAEKRAGITRALHALEPVDRAELVRRRVCATHLACTPLTQAEEEDEGGCLLDAA